MNNITYQTNKIRIEKILSQQIGVDDNIVFITFYRGYAKLPIPYTFGLLTRWVPSYRLDRSEDLAAATAIMMFFRNKYKLIKIQNEKVLSDEDLTYLGINNVIDSGEKQID